MELEALRLRGCTGTDLITLNLARTAIHEAVADALKEAHVAYTLPPVRGGGQASPEIMHAWNDGAGAGGSGLRAATAQPGNATAEQSKAAAAQLVLLG